VASLTLMEPLLGFLLQPDAVKSLNDTAQAALPKFAVGDHAGALDAWLTSAFCPGFRSVLEQALPGAWEQAVQDANTSFGVELAALQEWPRGPADLESVRVPTLSLVHRNDSWPGFAQIHEGLLSGIPRCEAATVDARSHMLPMDQPLVVARAISSFLMKQRVDTAVPEE
jgi:pimeloyl-ACP methyl ester carboxylesterase